MSITNGILTARPLAEWEYQGIKCAACLNPMGSINGYALIPDGNPLGAKDLAWDDAGELDVHGGVTFGPEKTDGGWLVGWDTLHFGDLDPKNPQWGGRHWSLGDVIEETNHLATQIKEANP